MGTVIVADFFVEGVAIPQGSKTARIVPASGGKPAFTVLYNDNDKTLKPWRALVTKTAREHLTVRAEGPIRVGVLFCFVRPKSVTREWPTVKPDLDKLLRSVMDGITDAGLWRDDAQVVVAHIQKVYAERAGVQVRIEEDEGDVLI